MTWIPSMTRRTALLGLGTAGLAVALPTRLQARDQHVSDADIFNFALNLESLETE